MANNTKTWKLEKRFKEIEEMHKKLARKINDIPFLPAKSIFQLFGEALDKRRDELEKYFNVNFLNKNFHHQATSRFLLQEGMSLMTQILKNS